MRKIVWGVTTLALGVGLGMGGNVTASAASGTYSVRRSNSVRLVWRKTMRQHAYTTTTGVRYSKHLGMRYSNAALGANTVWVTDGHEKLYNKVKGTAAIYYHVTTSDGTANGWIWRGYLTAQTTTAVGKTSTPATTTNPTTPSTTKSTGADTAAITASILKDLSGGAEADTQTTALANRVLDQMVSGQYQFSRNMSVQPGWEAGTTWGGSGNKTDDAQFFKLLAANKLVYGFGLDKTISSARIGTKQDVLSSLSNQSWDEDNEFDGEGTYGVTRENFYLAAKIGIATKRLADGRYAMFSIIRLPAYYGNIALYDE
ncbi:MAG TPA: hypothetical protein H9875_06475 [Candidatus Levilactobacillus faecigallinarum]|uniref:Uncharacterized protein n=1 Tax=Candidatus Levilactobacillus faecigallinarum TaxID=2838638 RepID=A0A9D1QSI4_9LACO|nr:hypothetical protein [Candidatus Levilactobacillus faecigallinarum]